MAFSNVFGYDSYMIRESGFRNVVEGDRIVGFQVELRLANYRGYILSQVEDIRIKVDGESVARDLLRFTVDGRTYTLQQMEETIDDRWELRQTATLTCLVPGGLSAGQHEVTVEEHIRASYLPFTAVSVSTKVLTLEG